MDKKNQNIIPSSGIQEESVEGANSCTVSVLSTDYMESVIDNCL